MTETKRIYIEADKQMYDERREEIDRRGYKGVFVEPSYEKYKWEKENNKLRGEW